MEKEGGSAAAAQVASEARQTSAVAESSVPVAEKVATSATPDARLTPAPAPASAPGTAGEVALVVLPVATAAGTVTATAPGTASPGGASANRKKRGRPRKYGPDGSLLRPLNATPISASAPPAAGGGGGGGGGGGWYTPAVAVGAALKRGRGRGSADFPGRQPQPVGFHFDSLGGTVACSAGANFTPHIITVAPGEDVTMKVISFSQQGHRAICILSANGVVSNVTLRQPDSSGGTLTYEGRFELLSLSGSFMPNETGGTKSRSGGMSVSLASPDGRVVGGCVAGLLVAASPVQIVVGSFLPSYQLEPKIRKPKAPTSVPAYTPAVPIQSVDANAVRGEQGQHSSTTTASNVGVNIPFREGWNSAVPPVPESRTPSTEFKISISGA